MSDITSVRYIRKRNIYVYVVVSPLKKKKLNAHLQSTVSKYTLPKELQIEIILFII